MNTHDDALPRGRLTPTNLAVLGKSLSFQWEISLVRRTVCAILATIVTVGCKSTPAPPLGSFRVTDLDIKAPNGSTQSVPTAVVTDAFFTSVNITASEGRLFAREDFSSPDRLADPKVLISYRLAKLSGKSVGSCITISGHCRSIIGVLPETFDSPSGTMMWTSTDLKALRERELAKEQHVESLKQRLTLLCTQKPAGPSPSRTVNGPLLVAVQSQETRTFLTGSQQESVRLVAPPKWGISSLSMDANGEVPKPWAGGRDLATLQPQSLACVLPTNIPVPGRTVMFFSDKTSHSEPVYTVQWKVDVLQWSTGALVASRTFRDTPSFKSSSGIGTIGTGFRLSFGSGEQYGDPSKSAETWLRSLIRQ